MKRGNRGRQRYSSQYKMDRMGSEWTVRGMSRILFLLIFVPFCTVENGTYKSGKLILKKEGEVLFFIVFFSFLIYSGGHSPGIYSNIEKVSEKNGAIVSVWENIK